jgi:effector-binding domain-containing protein
MLETPHITETAAQLTAVIPVTAPRTEIGEVMGPGIAELRAALGAQGLSPAGPWFARYLRMVSDTLDFEIGVPVSSPVAPVGRVRPGQLPAARVARTVHHGAYDGLHAAWAEFGSWVAAKGLQPGPGFWESYLAGPESNPDPAAWRTELNMPLVG